MASLTFTQLDYADVKLSKLVHAVEIAIALGESNARPQALAQALKNALSEFHQPARKPAKGERVYGNRTAN